MQARRVFVTGATGLVGRHAVAALTRAGCDVTVLLRRAPAAVDPAVRVVFADLRHAADLAPRLAGHDAVLHAAGPVVAGDGESHAVLVDGTRALLAAAERAGVARFVHVSSLAVLGPSPAGELGPASPWRSGDTARLPYVAAKLAAERIVDEARRRGARREATDAIEVVVARPGVVLGEGDRTTTPAILRALRRPFAARIGDGANAIPCVAAAELGEALARATWLPGLAGAALHLAARERVTQRMLLEWHAAAAGLCVPSASVSAPAAFAIAHVCEAACRLTGGAPALSRLAVAVAIENARVVTSAPESRLGWRGTQSCRDAVVRAVAWLDARRAPRPRPTPHSLPNPGGCP